MAVQSSIILNLIALIPDAALAEQIKARYYQDLEAQTNYVQTRVGELEIHLSEQMQQSFGATDEMVSEVLAISRRSEGAVSELRGEFRALAEKVDDHDREIASFRQSRDQSIAERKQLRVDLAESRADRESIHQELAEAKAERRSIIGQLKAITEMLSGRPGADEAQQLIDLLHLTVGRVDRLEQNDRS